MTVNLINSHGETIYGSRGARKACDCMAKTFPLIEREMIRRGLIKRTIDVFQGAYNKGVAASAGTHDAGGVIDVAQGITREQRQVWADFGVMMFPRTREFGWTTGDHGHGVWNGCTHQTASAAKQVRDGLAGRDGLVGNRVRNFIRPTRTWQQALAALLPKPAPPAPSPAPKPAVPKAQEDPVPTPIEFRQAVRCNGNQWAVTGPIVKPGPRPLIIDANATFSAPAGVTVKTRWVSWSGKEWVRYGVTEHAGNEGSTSWAVGQAAPGADLRLDVWTDKPAEVQVHASCLEWVAR